MRLPGGSERIDPSLPYSDEQCMITHESFKENQVSVFKMPCGHPMSSNGLIDYALDEVCENRKTDVQCPLCSAIWPLYIIKKYGNATKREMKQLEVGIAKNSIIKSRDISECPGCHSYCRHEDSTAICMKCIICSKKNKSNYKFCWLCHREWKSDNTYSCGNPHCNNADKLSLLKICGTIKVEFIDAVIFKLRACPKCGMLIEFKGGCKQMQCEVCKVEFCFVCLKTKSHGSWPCGSFNNKCGVAPVQTSIQGVDEVAPIKGGVDVTDSELGECITELELQPGK